MTLGRGLLGALGKQTKSKGSRKGPALVAVAAGLGAAGAAALKRRRSGEDQATVTALPTDPASEPAAAAPDEPASSPGSA